MYCLSIKYLPILYNKSLYKMGNFLDIQYVQEVLGHLYNWLLYKVGQAFLDLYNILSDHLTLIVSGEADLPRVFYDAK